MSRLSDDLLTERKQKQEHIIKTPSLSRPVLTRATAVIRCGVALCAVSFDMEG